MTSTPNSNDPEANLQELRTLKENIDDYSHREVQTRLEERVDGTRNAILGILNPGNSNADSQEESRKIKSAILEQRAGTEHLKVTRSGIEFTTENPVSLNLKLDQVLSASELILNLVISARESLNTSLKGILNVPKLPERSSDDEPEEQEQEEEDNPDNDNDEPDLENENETEPENDQGNEPNTETANTNTESNEDVSESNPTTTIGKIAKFAWDKMDALDLFSDKYILKP